MHKFMKNDKFSPRPERPHPGGYSVAVPPALRFRFRAIRSSVSSEDEEQFVSKRPKKK